MQKLSLSLVLNKSRRRGRGFSVSNGWERTEAIPKREKGDDSKSDVIFFHHDNCQNIIIRKLNKPDLEGEKDFNDHHGQENTDFVQSILGFQECDKDVESWMACDAEDCRFQMLNHDEIVTYVQGKSDSVDDEDEDNNNNESSKGPSNADAFSALKTAMK
ncbi:uncharacterized protein TNCV_385931 [Trichonephila clavipes]|nr:uncharacterized protein TNCV_385931 [Trichonephila clavipes]